MNVTVYGDSILKGVLLENGKYIVNKVWEELIAKRFGLSIRNRSRFGCTIEKGLSAIRKDCESACDPGEWALIEFGGNDCDYDWAAISAEPDRDYDCKTPPEAFVTNYREAIRLIRESGREPIAMTLPPIHSERYLRFICRNGLSRDNILHWLGDVEAISRWQEKYSVLARKVAEEEQVDLIDLRSAFASDGSPLEDLLCEDGIHPSRKGQKIIYRTICEKAG